MNKLICWLFSIIGVIQFFDVMSIYTDFIHGDKLLAFQASTSAFSLLVLFIGVFLMIKRFRSHAKELLYHIEHDSQTKLPNRSYFEKCLDKAFKEAEEKACSFSVIAIRIDRYDELNFTLGHKLTDQISHKIYEVIREIIKPEDEIAHLVSRSLGVLLNKADAEQTEQLLNAISERFEQPLKIDGMRIDIDIHMGVARYPEHGSSKALLMQHAAFARYLAEKDHKKWCVYSSYLDSTNIHRLSLMGELLKGLKNEECLLYYQPKVDVKTKKTVEVESLIRWKHPVHGFISPDEFIPLAEQTGHINELTRFVVREGYKQAKIWKDKNIPVRISINLSPRNLVDKKLTDLIFSLADELALDPKMIMFEVTESAIVNDPAEALKMLYKMKDKGFLLSLDDFGTGYSSLEYLKDMPVDELKIDQSFVLDVERNEKNQAILKSTTQLAHNLGLKLVAEGVENQISFDLAESYGVDTIQGYFISKPLPVEEFNLWYQKSPWGK